MSTIEAIEAVIGTISTARRGIQLYPATHPAYQEALDAVVVAVKVAANSGSFAVNLYEGRLYHESVVLPESAIGAQSIAEAFESRRIESLTFHPSFTTPDALGLVEVLTLKPSPELDVEAELAVRSVTAVTVSFLEDQSDEEKQERRRQRQADRAMYQRVVTALRQLQERLSTVAVTDFESMGGLVNGVLERMIVDQPAVLGLATIHDRNEHAVFHSLNVAIYSMALGQRLGLPEEGLHSLGLSALLHDVGKAAFDHEDPAQAEACRLMHPKVGSDIIQRAGLEDPAPMLVAYEHHMFADGSGWPERDEGYVAHPYSRMVAIANRYESLTNPPDGEGLTPDKAIIQVVRESDKQLDPFFARLFANALGVFPVGCLLRLSDQSVGVVVRPTEDPLAPVVRVAYDAKGEEPEDGDEIDLGACELSVVEVVAPSALNVEVSDKL